jgi:spore coat protein A
VPAPGARPKNDVPFFVFANDQGYLPTPVLAPGNQLTMCPGERYEILVNFAPYNGRNVTMTNSAPAPFPAGITPFAGKSPFAMMNTVMQFQVVGSGIAGAVPVTNLNPLAVVMAFNQANLRPAPVGTTVRQVYLNERVDGVTLAPLGMQLNGVPFEYKVTETPTMGSTEVGSSSTSRWTRTRGTRTS